MTTFEEKSESELLRETENLARKFKSDFDHQSFDYEELVSMFHMYMKPLIRFSPLNLYNNGLSRFIKDFIGNRIPGCIRDEFHVYEEDSDFKEEMNSMTETYREVCLSKSDVSDCEVEELYNLALIDSDDSYLFTKYLLGRAIDGKNKFNDKMLFNLISRFANLLGEKNDINFSFSFGKVYNGSMSRLKNRDGLQLVFDKKKVMNDGIVNCIQDIFSELWSCVQKSDDYNDEGVIELIRIDQYNENMLGDRYYHQNSHIMSDSVDCILHSTYMISDFLRDVAPNTYEIRKKDLVDSASYYDEVLYDRTRYLNGVSYDIDVLFDKSLAIAGRRREDVLKRVYSPKHLVKELEI